jgi:hypothetical protein
MNTHSSTHAEPNPTPTLLSHGRYLTLLGERYYQIAHYDQMPPFFMSLVSPADHWLFISSTGGLTAGRVNSDSALFPYETDDKITAHHELTGSKTLLRLGAEVWEPFSSRSDGRYRRERHLYKNNYGNKLLFEEINHDLHLTMRVMWRTSDRFGFVRSCWLENNGGESRSIELLDGVQNVLPAGATAQLQTTMSNLLHAYKRSELVPDVGLGIFALSATLSDRAAPSESLRATAVWQTGLTPNNYLLSSSQIDGFRHGQPLTSEQDICGQAGSYFVHTTLNLAPNQSQTWHIVADVQQDHSAIVQTLHFLRQTSPAQIVEAIETDIAEGTAELAALVGSADGGQQTAQENVATHHFANTLFNIMRGGIFADGYNLPTADVRDFLHTRNRPIAQKYAADLANLPASISLEALLSWAKAQDDPALLRLAYEYMPLRFSRRHGDPSRPWNQFAINLKKPDGTAKLDYQGNWRDIFQNWEPLARTYPAYLPSIIAKFLNATTADGYNPYRVTRNGIEWEVPEPHNPWSNIGYWSDHQIIYLQKLLEMAEQSSPQQLADLLNAPIYSYANVPYRLKPYAAMLANWADTIEFDWELEGEIATAVSHLGTDGKLVLDETGNVRHVTMMEKMLALLLAKLANFVPDGGIWMNTQRPEWNDANNALVGKGISVVTAAYLTRFVTFWQTQLAHTSETTFAVNETLATLFRQLQEAFEQAQPHLEAGFTPATRKGLMDELGTAVSAYRAAIYTNGVPSAQTALPRETIHAFLALTHHYLNQTLRTNLRPDGLAHTYNVLHLTDDGVEIERLYLMLEGQVALLSAGLLTPAETVSLLRAMRHSELYRADQHSYMLYPKRELAGFLHKNNVPADQVASLQLIQALQAKNDPALMRQDADGVYHFNGGFHNADDVVATLDKLAQNPTYAPLVANERATILAIFEETFNHRAFTGRSGTFFAYEGLGSIYWHMVAKLLLAVQEVYQQAIAHGEDEAIISALAAHYYDIRAGLGYEKSPAVYGAFPTDPYSHTPWGAGAKQPGMTGQVKEELLTRWGELGVLVHEGQIRFQPSLLRAEEFVAEPTEFVYTDVAGQTQTLPLPAEALAFTFCRVPVVYVRGDDVAQVAVHFADGKVTTTAEMGLDRALSQEIFGQSGVVTAVVVTIPHM